MRAFSCSAERRWILIRRKSLLLWLFFLATASRRNAFQPRTKGEASLGVYQLPAHIGLKPCASSISCSPLPRASGAAGLMPSRSDGLARGRQTPDWRAPSANSSRASSLVELIIYGFSAKPRAGDFSGSDAALVRCSLGQGISCN